MRNLGMGGWWVLAVSIAACGGRASSTSQPAPTAVGATDEEAAASTEHSGHGSGEGMTLEKLAATAIAFDDLGEHRRAVTTRSPEAQAFFDQGLALLYGFNHDESTRLFAKAAALDPTCAMCFWGASVTLGPNYNVPMLPDRSVMAWTALEKARQAAAGASPVEQDLIGALARRYKGPEPLDPVAMAPFNQAYAEAMREVATRYPEDDDVQVLFAESMMNLNPWKLWSLEGEPAPGTAEIVATLERVLARNPKHPGANHYYIHAVEASRHPEKAEPAADRLASLVPGAGHIVHMPAHIFQRVGRYADASEANRRAAKADAAYLEKIAPWGYYGMYVGHNYGFLAYSASMEGRSEESVMAAREAARAMPPGMIDMMPGMDFFVAEPLLVMVRFGKFDELLAEPRPDPKYVVLTSFWLHGHGMALASRGQLDQARADLAALVRLAETAPAGLTAGNNAAEDVFAVAAKVLEARIAEKAGDVRALPLWADAVALADKVAYSEPADWFYPVRHYQGAALLAAKKYREAEAVYRKDLEQNPKNGWAYFGLARALEGQKKLAEARKADAEHRKAWARADFQLGSTAF
jgi:tetratricopeptide (TPR) repeat protein